MGFILGLEIESSRTTIPAIKNGEIPIEDWVQPELMLWLTLYQQEYQTLLALHKEGKPYACLPPNVIKDAKFYESFVYYRPDYEPNGEMGEWPDRIDLPIRRRHMEALQGAITMMTFNSYELPEVCLGKERYALFDSWVGGYNNFVYYVAGELRAQGIPYMRIEYDCRYESAAAQVDWKTDFLEHMHKHESEVLPLFPGTAADVYATEKQPFNQHLALQQEQAYAQEYLHDKKAEAAKLAPAFDGLL